MKLKYIGFRAKGQLVFSDGGKLSVVRNEIYDIPEKHVDGLILSKCWEKAEVKKVKKIILKEKEDIIRGDY